jgi:hypothetical protein
MRLAHRLFLVFVACHIGFVLASLVLPSLGPIAGLGGASLYLPLLPLKLVGLPVFGRSESGGWSSPSGLGIVLVVAFWSVVWLLVAHAAESVSRRHGTHPSHHG